MFQLLLELQQISELKGYNKPHYQPELKVQVGYLDDWMAAGKITYDDVNKALKQAKNLPQVAKLKDAGFELYINPTKTKGTINFIKDGKRYSIYPHGLIRLSTNGGHFVKRHVTRLKSPKTRVVPGDAVKTVLRNYEEAMKELLNKKTRD